jgi:hypothetical protein
LKFTGQQYFEVVVFCLCAVRKTKKASAYVWLQEAMY